MPGSRKIEATSRDAIPGASLKMAPIWTGDGTRTKTIRFARRVGGLALLIAAALALTSFRAFCLERSAAPRPAAAPVTAEVLNKAEQHLLAIGYWGPAANRAAERARSAILAFQRVEGRNQTGKLDAAGAQAALAATRPVPRETGYSHIEVDLQRQVLFVVDQKIGVTLVLPVSSGSG